MDAESIALFGRTGSNASVTNTWAMEVQPGQRFLYELSRPGGRLFQVEFDLSQPVDARLAAAEPEDAGEDPVAPRELRIQRLRPDFAGPAAPAQHGALGQAVADLRAHLMEATWRAVRTALLAHTVQRGGNRQAHVQLPVGKSVQALVGDGDMQEVERAHGPLA